MKVVFDESGFDELVLYRWHACILASVGASFSDHQVASVTPDCFMGDMFVAVQQTLKEVADRLVGSVKEVTGASAACPQHLRAPR